MKIMCFYRQHEVEGDKVCRDSHRKKKKRLIFNVTCFYRDMLGANGKEKRFKSKLPKATSGNNLGFLSSFTSITRQMHG